MKINKKDAKAADAPKEEKAAKGKKADAPAKEAGEKKKSNLPAKEEYKYGVKELAERMGIKEASVRVQLRNKEVPKAGKSYGWNTDKEFDAVVKTMKAEPPKGEKAK